MAVLQLDDPKLKNFDHTESGRLIEGITNFSNYPFWGISTLSLSMAKMIVLSAFIIMFFGGGILKARKSSGRIF